MKDEQKVFIRSVEGRGKEVIKMLEDLGGKNVDGMEGEYPDTLYYINHFGNIYFIEDYDEMAKIIMDNYQELHLPEQWKNGNVLINVQFSDIFAVCKSACNTRDDTYHCYMYADFGCDEIDAEGSNILRSNYRLATPTEIEHFHELLHKHGKDWDAEKKELVEWRWKPKIGESYFFIDSFGEIHKGMICSYNNKKLFDFGNYFKTEEEAGEMAEKIKKLLKGGDK